MNFSCDICERTLKGQWAITDAPPLVSTVQLGDMQVHTSPLAQGGDEEKCLFWPASLLSVTAWFSSGQETLKPRN